MDERKRKDRVNKAKLILENDLFKEAVEVLDQEILRLYRSTPSNDKERLSDIRRNQEILVKFIQHFETILKEGKMAEGLVEKPKRLLWPR